VRVRSALVTCTGRKEHLFRQARANGDGPKDEHNIDKLGFLEASLQISTDGSFTHTLAKIVAYGWR